MMQLPHEPTAEQVLNGEYPFPPSPAAAVNYDDNAGFAHERLTPTPPPGVHPRILLGPDDLPDVRRRLRETHAGRAMLHTLRERVGATIHAPGAWERELFDALADGQMPAARAILDSGQTPSHPPGHYQPHMLYAIVMEAFDALVHDDAKRGRRAASAVASYAALAEPQLDKILQEPLADDVWRVRLAGPPSGKWSEAQGVRDLMGGHLLGYAYDFAAPFMTGEQQQQTRRVIAKATHGRIFMGARLPHHWRNWNWVMCAMGQPLLALAIEGEPGYDPRIYTLAVQVAHDFLTYGISPNGSATEAVGYAQFGLVWGNPFFAAAARRGDNLLLHSHHRAMLDWYLQSMEPYAPGWSEQEPGDAEQQQRNLPPLWTSHGDGGDEGPSLQTMLLWKHFFPADPKVDFLYRMVLSSSRQAPFTGRFHIVEPLIWAEDAAQDATGPSEPDHGASLHAPLTWFDAERGTLIARAEWTPQTLAVQFECRPDAHSASHEHADRGNFTLSALGRQWAKESFRSIETRHHNCVLVDGMGQGFWPGPAQWLGLHDGGWAVMAACDSRDAYNYWWPKGIVTNDPNPDKSPRFNYARWQDYQKEAEQFQKLYGNQQLERDTRPAVVSHFQGFEQGDPRLWDEDGWPLRLTHNPVQRAFRTIALARGVQPYALVVDDIQKDDTERLYEWLMMTGPNTDAAVLDDNEIILCDATGPRSAQGLPEPKTGDRLLLVRILETASPAAAHHYQSRPSVRLETFEKKDTLAPGGRSFGRDRRLVVPSRSIAPRYKVLLFPHRKGDALPETTWRENGAHLTVQWPGQHDAIDFQENPDGRTRVTLTRKDAEGKITIA